ncbi:MAG: AsmA-like C-terminal region-containing protein [Myxococcota bacterium]
MRRVLVFLCAVALLPVLGLVAAPFVLEPLVNRYRADIAAAASEYLGRPVDFGRVEVTWRDGFGLLLLDARLRGADANSPAQVTIGSALLRMDLWKAVRSRGRRLEATAAVVTAPVVRVVRDAEGRWDFDDIRAHLEERARAHAPTTTEDANSMLQGLKIAGVTIEDGRVEIEDRLLQRRLIVDRLRLELSTIVAGQDVSAKLAFTLDDGRTRAPLTLDVTLLPLPARFDFQELPAMDLHVTLKDLELDAWVSLLDAKWMRPSSGRLTLDVKTTTHAGGVSGAVKGFVKVDRLVVAKGDVRGEPTDVQLDVDVDADLKTSRFEVRKADITGPGVTLSTRASIVSRSIAGIRNVLVDLKVEDLSRVVAVVPRGSGIVPSQLSLTGPFEVHLEGDPQEAQFSLDLEKARVAWADVVDKKPGIPLQLKVLATRSEERVELQPFALIVADARLAGWLDLPANLDGPMEGALYTGDIKLSQVRSIFPVVARAQRREDLRLDGLVQVSANASMEGSAQAVDLRVRLRRMDVRLPSTSLRGNAELAAKLAPHDAESSQLEAHANFTDLAVRKLNDEGSVVVDKPLGMPMKADLVALRRGDLAQLQQGDVQLGHTDLRLQGQLKGLLTAQPEVTGGIEDVDLAFDDVRRISPAARSLPRAGRLRTRLGVEGKLLQPETLKISADELEIVADGNRVAGTVLVSNPANAQVDVQLTSVELDLRRLRKLTGINDIPPEGRVNAAVSVRGAPTDASSLEVTVENLHAKLYGSNVTGRASVRNLQAPTFAANLVVDRLDVDAIQKQRGGGRAAGPNAATTSNDDAHGLDPRVRERLQRLNGEAELSVGVLRHRGYVARDVALRVRVERGVVTCDRLDLGIYHGTISLTGTRVDPTGEWLNTRLVLVARGLDLAEIYDGHAKEGGRLHGTLDVDGDVTARGMSGKDIERSLSGTVGMTSPEVVIRGINLLEEMLRPLANTPGVGALLVARPQDDLQDATTLEDFHALARIHEGRVRLEKPMSARTVFGGLQLDGSAGFDSTLALVGTALLQPHILGELTDGRVEPPEAVLVPVRMGGTWSDVRLDGVDLRAFVRALGLPGELGNVAESAQRELVEGSAQARKLLGRVIPGGKKPAQKTAPQNAATP